MCARSIVSSIGYIKHRSFRRKLCVLTTGKFRSSGENKKYLGILRIMVKDHNAHLRVILVIFLGHLISRATCLENYDFIICGGGTGGLAVARRLAETGKHTVLVLESGNFPKEGMDVPALSPRFVRDSDVTFQYQSVPQRNAGLITNGVITVVSGRMLSGTSNLNHMWFNRGNPSDYDNWGNVTHDSTWNYSNMLKYFKNVETYQGSFPSDQHGFSGPITVSRPRYAPGLEHWLAAGKSLGYPTADPNGPQRRSFTPVDFAKHFGRRHSAFKGYIQPVLPYLPNLRIILNTNVTQIIFKGKRAVGVRFNSTSHELSDVRDNCLYANKEIIVSSGAYGSPLLLMRSGIGPRNVLQAAKIPIVQELPVGQNFQDHVALTLHIIINDKRLVMDEDRDLNPETWEYFNKFGDGPYSNTRGATGQGFAVSSEAILNGEKDWPDLHLILMQNVQAFYDSGVMNTTQNNATIASWEAPMGAMFIMTRPKSRGSIRLNPLDPNGLPLIELGYLSDSVKEIVRLFEQTPPYRKLGARFPPVDIPMCRRFPFGTDDYWRCYIRWMSGSGCHPAGTCRMGWGQSDPEAVVDTKLRVIGVTGLRVVDASIMPFVTNANTHAAVYGIAEKASDMILSDWQGASSLKYY